MIKKLLVANRGEIAVRVIRAAHELGIKTVAVYSEGDRSSMHVALAGEAVCIGPAPATLSYLNQDAILAAAKITQATAIHPGYGFLAENASFAQACGRRGIVFVGPSPESIEAMGYKSQAKTLAKRAGTPVVPGTDGVVDPDVLKNKARLKKIADSIGYPIMVKASAGGGGKGLRFAKDFEALQKEAPLAANEAQAAFGDGAVYLERFIESPRHIEIQVAADRHGAQVAFAERDCSIQRRHQKLIEESPSPAVDEKLRARLAEASIALVRESGYYNVGTIEYIMNPSGEFFFMEMNTRLQVEHPVTELVSGIDLVQLQLRIASGEKLGVGKKRALETRGHSIEHRINAENPDANFAPSPGRVDLWRLPAGPGVRFDSHVYPGYTIPPHYDSMIGKLILSAENRPATIARAKRALDEFRVEGIHTTARLHARILDDPDFAAGRFDTSFLESKPYLLSSKAEEPSAA